MAFPRLRLKLLSNRQASAESKCLKRVSDSNTLEGSDRTYGASFEEKLSLDSSIDEHQELSLDPTALDVSGGRNHTYPDEKLALDSIDECCHGSCYTHQWTRVSPRPPAQRAGRKVAFIDEKPGLAPGNVVTETRYRLRTTYVEKQELYYTLHDFIIFEREKKAERIRRNMRMIESRRLVRAQRQRAGRLNSWPVNEISRCGEIKRCEIKRTICGGGLVILQKNNSLIRKYPEEQQKMS